MIAATLLSLVAALQVPTEPVGSTDGAGPVPTSELDRLRERERQLLMQIGVLEAELRAERARSLARQEEWIVFTRLLQGFEVPSLPQPPEFIAEALVDPRDPAAEALERAEAERRGRGRQVAAALKTLLKAESVRGFDLLEVGLLHEHEGRTWTGPVIARLVDERGRMVGMLKAARLRLEVSRSARSVSVLLEEGYESRGGVRRPFEGGAVVPGAPKGAYQVRGGRQRIYLGAVDPEPWVEALPELVDPMLLSRANDDGLWDLKELRVQLVRLLHEAAQAGDSRWRLIGLGGVRGRELRDVQFAELNPVTGRAERRVFADSVRVLIRRGGGVELQFEGGSVRRGSRVAPFLAGQYRIVLPRANASEWQRAALPGLSAPPLRPAIPSPGAEGPSAGPGSGAQEAEDLDSEEIVGEQAAPVR